MNYNCLVCSSCEKIMATYELHEFYCSKTNLVIKLEERVCLTCGADALQIVNVTSADAEGDMGRSESLEITCSGNRPQKKLSKSFISELIQIYFWERIKNLCFLKTKCVWYKGYEIDLWDSINGYNKLNLMPEQIEVLSLLSKNLNLWVLNPADWYGMENQATPFISIKNWQRLLSKKDQKFKSANEHSSDYA